MSKQPLIAPIEGMPFPFYHHALTYDESANASFQRLLVVWYQVADILKTKPPGTMIQAGHDGFVMGVMNGELSMFISEDLLQHDSDVTSSVYRVEDFDSIGAVEFDEINAALSAWLKFQTYSFEVDPTHIANVLRHAYKSESVALWKWSGNNPKGIGQVEFTVTDIFHLLDGLSTMIDDTQDFEKCGEKLGKVAQYQLLKVKLASALRTVSR